MTKEKEQESLREIAQLEFEDVLVTFNSNCEQYGVRHVLAAFRDSYPQMYEELVTQINRLPPQREVAALLR